MLKKIFLLILFWSIVPCYGTENYVVSNDVIQRFINTIQQKRNLALPIGIKIWFNECDGTDQGLTSWNKGENFASLGIAHFLWYPHGKVDASFPKLLNYLRQKGVAIPQWLMNNAESCPWKNRATFYREFNSVKMVELRTFLKRTVALQAEFLIDQFTEAVPLMLKVTPKEERAFIFNKLKILANTPQGLYALIDFMNFKGTGLANYYEGTGLLQVLRQMSQAPDQRPLAAFVWSAKQALVLRTLKQPHLAYENWLKGWLQRIDSYQ